jgi:hypothetical protein
VTLFKNPKYFKWRMLTNRQRDGLKNGPTLVISLRLELRSLAAFSTNK